MNKNHRPVANFKGEIPRTEIKYGVDDIKVTLDAFGPENPYWHLLREIQSTWGDKPFPTPEFSEDLRDFTKEEMTLIKDCIRGKSLGQCLEAITTMWTIEGISRACTHQLVRTRIGAGFMQQGGRNNDWRHQSWRMPEALVRICEPEPTTVFGLKDCVVDEEPIKNLEKIYGKDMKGIIREYLEVGKYLYASLVDAGLAYQDARRLLPIGTTTWIHANYSFATLKNLLANRLEFCMDWEINAVAQLMVREVKMKMPELFGNSLKSHSDKLRRAAFADHVDDFPPDQKYPFPWRQSERTHRPEQHPFFVLKESSLAGGPIEWIKTDGIYPDRPRGEITK